MPIRRGARLSREERVGVIAERAVDTKRVKGKSKKDGFEFEFDADVDGARAAFAEAAASFGDENEWATIVAGVMDETRR